MTNTIIEPILDHCIKIGASDIHMTEGETIGFRIHGELGKVNGTTLDAIKINKITEELFKHDEKNIEDFHQKKDADFAYIHKDGTPFRVNAFYKLGRISFVLRKIASEARTIEDLGLPRGVEKFTKAKGGLILVTGPTGSGKSTSMISILDAINKTRREHILTIEDPTEFIFKDDKSIFSQREVGKDTRTFATALRAAMREDPDIVMVGEMRDKETVEAAVELAETGHLVISTLHTAGSVQTITRLVNFFHPELQHSFRYKLGDILFGVLSQRLIPKVGGGRAGIYEVMMMTPGIRNLIRSGDLVQINNAIEMGQSEGMIAMRTYADNLRDKGVIKEEDYINYFMDDM
ncbi:MAG: type IV pilus twitching motility protein PilT [Candidatus Altimarinota bacterium]